MELIDQINTIDCESGDVLGTGLAGCRIDRQRITALGLVTKGFKFAETITKEYMRTLQQDGTLIMLQGVVSFTDQTADDNITTRAGSGIKKLAGKNPYEYLVGFDNGINFHKALTSLSGYEQYDLILFDVTNSMFFTVSPAGDMYGFTLGMFENGKYVGADGSDASGYTVLLQLIERYEIDKYQSWITSENLDFAVRQLTGVNQVTVKANPVVAAATTIIVSAKLSGDNKHPVKGLEMGDFKVTDNGAPVVVSDAVYDANTEKYTLTVPAIVAAHVYTVALNGIVLTETDVLYKSNADSVLAT